MPIKVEEYLGNRELLETHKTAFLCSRRVSSPAVLRCYDWATEACRSAGVVVSGFPSRIERDVLHFLLQGQKPLIVVIARRMYTVLASELQSAMDAGRLLIVSTAPKATRASQTAADERNRYIAELADEIVFGYIAPDSRLNELYRQYASKSGILFKSQDISSG